MRSFLHATLLLLLLFGLSFGAGFGLYEFGARASSLGGAVVAQSYDASSIFYNPAGLAFQKGTQFYGDLTLITASNKWIGPAPVFADEAFKAEKQIHTPFGAYISHSFSEKLAVGLGVTTPFGLGLKWPSDFPGDVVSKDVNLKSFYFSPVVSYRLLENLGIGAGVDLVYSTVTLERYILFPEDSKPGTNVGNVSLDGNSKLAVGFSASLLYKYDNLSLGFLYRHKVKNEFDGNATFNIKDEYYRDFLTTTAGLVDQKVKTEITYPSFLSVGAHYQIMENMGIEFDYMWYKWDVFKSLVLDFAKTQDVSVEEDYSNSSQFRVGVHYNLTPAIELRGGYIYDQTPQPIGSMSPLLPDATRNDFSLGVGYKTGSMQFDLGYMLVLFDDRGTVVNGQGKSFDGFDGNYTGVANLLFVGYGISF